MKNTHDSKLNQIGSVNHSRENSELQASFWASAGCFQGVGVLLDWESEMHRDARLEVKEHFSLYSDLVSQIVIFKKMLKSVEAERRPR